MKCLSHEKESVIPTKLINDLRNGNVLAWIGAGMSIGVGYPSWNQLVNTIAENISNVAWEKTTLPEWTQKNASSNPEWVAEVLSTTNKKEYFDALKNEFKLNKNQLNLTHAILGILPFKGYITTNYDTLIESNLEVFTKYKPMVFKNDNAMSLLTDYTDQKFVYKIHGDINSDLENIILTETDYYALQRDEIYKKILSWLFSKYTLVSFGYSLRDRDFRSILNERYELFKGNCPPFYVFTSSSDTCKEEIDCYRSKFNVHIVSISPDYKFQELTSTLLSIYCLCHRIESEHNNQDIVNLLNMRISNNKPFQLELINNNDDMVKTCRMLSVIKDPLEISEIVSILSESGVNTTSAHVELLCKWIDNKRVICENQDDKISDRKNVAKILKKNIDVIPIDDNPKFLSSYYKHIVDKYYNTLSYLLIHKESFKILIKTKNELKRIVEYYKQQGLWQEWIKIAKSAQSFCEEDLKIELLRSLAWVYFWTRDYENLKEIIDKNPQIDSELGVNNYKSKLYYMTSEGLEKLKCDLNKKYNNNKVDYFDISLLGRVYARLSTMNTPQNSQYLEKSEFFLKEALKQAKRSKDLIEIAVQNWYLSLVLIDSENLTEAQIHLSEAKRLDENIMERVPGIAWLRVAEYRLALKKNSYDVQQKRKIAYDAVDKLGMQKIDEYLDKEYYF